MRSSFTLLPTACFLVLLTAPARADIAFSGSGQSGPLAGPDEEWTFNTGWANQAGLNYWYGSGLYELGDPYAYPGAYGMYVSFSGGGPIDLPSVAFANGVGYCFAYAYGSGGTAMCNQTYHSGGDAIVTGPDSIVFPTYVTYNDSLFDAVVYFDGATPTSFSGEWITNPITSLTPYTPTPEPSSLLLLATGAIGSLCGLRGRMRA